MIDIDYYKTIAGYEGVTFEMKIALRDLITDVEREQANSIPVEKPVILPKPTEKTFTYKDLEKAYNDGYKNGMMNEAGLECTLFSSWYNWVHEIKSKA